MKKLVIGDIVSRAWDLAVKHWPIFILLIVIYNMLSGFGLRIDQTMYLEGIQNNDPTLISQAITVSPWMAVTFLIGIYLSYVIYNLYVNAYTTGRPYQTMSDAFKVDFNQLAIFFAVELVYGLIVGIGCIALIIPGIYLGICLWYAPLLAATQGASFTEAFSRSWQMTKGHFWELFLMGLTIIGIYILGFCACCVGYFFAAVIAYFMIVISFFNLKPEVPATETTTDLVEVQ
jgi:hypothetical protein